jgi:hypothetical protein
VGLNPMQCSKHFNVAIGERRSLKKKEEKTKVEFLL